MPLVCRENLWYVSDLFSHSLLRNTKGSKKKKSAIKLAANKRDILRPPHHILISFTYIVRFPLVDCDAYILEYSFADGKSFQSAKNKLSSLSKDVKKESTIILAANKSYILGNRTITHEGEDM